MKFLLDEMYAPAAAQQLRSRHVDALAVKEYPELPGLSDDAILALAVLDGRVLITENVADFVPLGRTVEHLGIVLCHPRRFPRDPSHIRRLIETVASLDAESPHGLGTQPIQWWLEPPTRRP